MRITKLASAALCLLLGAQAPALAGTVKVMISGGFSAAYADLVTAYEKQSGNTVETVHGPSMGLDPTALPARLSRGEQADVVILVRGALDKLVTGGQVKPDVTDLGISRVAMAVKAGAPHPDISTVEAFKQTLLNARSVAYADSASGVYLQTVLFKQLGIDKEMGAKSKMIQATPVGLNIARGEYELGFQQYSELKPIAGIEIVGFLPEAIQLVTPFSAGVPVNAPNEAGGHDLIRFLSSPAAYGAIRASGMRPAGEKGN